jgi:DNA-binding GntR family transcriptional regulator
MTAPPVGWPVPPEDDEPAPLAPAAADATGVRTRRPARPPARRADRAVSQGHAVSVLADRLAAALVHHEPGWRLPRHSALARRYNVSPAEIESAIEELVGRHLVRRLADGQLYRASPAEYVIGIEGVPGLTTYVDTMGGEFSCRGRQLTWRLPPEDIAWALEHPADQQMCVVRLLWTDGGEPAALCTTYVPGDLASQAGLGGPGPLPTTLNLLQVATVAAIQPQPAASVDEMPPAAASPSAQLLAGTPAALHIELQAPPPSVARSLRLTAGQPALMITVRFADPGTDRPVALTIAVLRPDMFRVIVSTPQPPLPGEDAASSEVSWSRAAEGWES